MGGRRENPSSFRKVLVADCYDQCLVY